MDNIISVITEYFTTKASNREVASVSGMLYEKSLDVKSILGNPEIYSMIKGFILSQGVVIPKHAHESIMEDFNQVMGERIVDNTLRVKKVTNSSIDVADFKREAEKMPITQDNAVNGGFDNL